MHVKHLFFSILLLIFVPLSHFAAIVHHGKLESDITGRALPYVVILPKAYDSLVQSGTRFPVLYMLHCAGCDQETPLSPEGGEFQNYIDSARFIIAIPHDGSVNDTFPFSWWLDSPLLATQQFSSFLVNEFKPHIDSLYATLPQAGNTGLCGHSMGGFGSLYNLIKHPRVFSCAFSIKGGFDISYPHNSHWPSYFGLDILLGTGEHQSGNWSSVNVLTTVSTLSGQQRKIAFYAGIDDTWFHDETVKLHNLMDSLKIAHTFYTTSEDHFGVPEEQAKNIVHFFDTSFTYRTDVEQIRSGYMGVRQLYRSTKGMSYCDMLGREVSVKSILSRRLPGVYFAKDITGNRGKSALIVVMP